MSKYISFENGIIRTKVQWYILQLRWKRFLDNKEGGVKMNSQVSGVWGFFRWVECTPNHTHWVNFYGTADVIMYLFLYLYLYLYLCLYYFLCKRCARVESWHGTAETINHSARRHQGELLSATLAATVGYTRQLEMFIWNKIQGACHQGELLLATLCTIKHLLIWSKVSIQIIHTFSIFSLLATPSTRLVWCFLF